LIASPILNRNRWLLSFVLLIGLVLLVACGGDGNNDSTAGDMAPPEQQVLRLRMNAEPKTIDPHISSVVTEATVARQLFAGLLNYDADLKVVPNLAKAVPTEGNGGISKDGKTYKVELVENAKWSDGRTLTANDFVYSMRRLLDPATAAPYASFYYSIEGARAYNTALGTRDAPASPSQPELTKLRDAVGVMAEGDRTVIYRLSEPDPSFLNLLALWTAFPVRADIIERHGAQWTEPGNHVGNGPFALRQWLHDQSMVLEPNPNWHGEAPKLTRLQINFIADDAAAYAAYLNGEIDSVTVPAAAVREATNPGSPLNSQLVIVPELSTFAFFMNNSLPPFDNKLVRQAFGLAIDREAYANGVLQGAAKPTTSWIPPGMPGYDEQVGKQYSFDPAKAKSLLAQAGFAEGRGFPDVTFMMPASDTNRIVGQFVQDQLKQNLGVNVSFDFVQGSAYGANLTSGNFQATIQRWVADWPYPDNWLEQFTSGSQNNIFSFRNQELDQLVAKAAAETSDRDRLKLYEQAHKLLVEEAPVMPLYNRVSYTLVKPNVKGLFITGIDGAIKGDFSFWQTYIATGGS
jgi:oligopeptide transport system substrate-binding protein